MEFAKLAQRAAVIREQYAQMEERRYGRSWTDEEIALGFVGDVGDLVKLVQAMNGIRDIRDAQNKLAHELADCLWSVLTLAQQYEIDLEKAFLVTMDELEERLNNYDSSQEHNS
ncbi:nucleotide pyrophosphohydrolase [Chloroflexi bacterium TSY]|nr:nucleotide pyrophosphohydrolase [Chloroflexi bacterium TSY]